jgi:hypothetical protein
MVIVKTICHRNEGCNLVGVFCTTAEGEKCGYYMVDEQI